MKACNSQIMLVFRFTPAFRLVQSLLMYSLAINTLPVVGAQSKLCTLRVDMLQCSMNREKCKELAFVAIKLRAAQGAH